MDQDVTFKDRLNLIEAQGWGVHEDVELKTTKFDKDIVHVLAMLEGTSFPLKFGHGLYIVRIGAHRKRAQSELVNALIGRWLGLQGDNVAKSRLWYHGDLEN